VSPGLGESSLERYRDQIGRARAEVRTPALLLDLAPARRNIATMARDIERFGVGLRPHIKVHKSPQLARMQVDGGACGVACATVWEAVVMARFAGVEDVLIANEVVGADKERLVAELARDCRLTVLVDTPSNVRELARTASDADTTLELLIEVDVGMGRAGVREPSQALALARLIEQLPTVRLRGVHGYEGHCMAEPDPVRRASGVRHANERLLGVLDALLAAEHACDVVSAGGTGTYRTVAANPRVTELQAGSYVVMDAFHERLVPDVFERALTVLATVISRHGSTIVLDCGRKAVSADLEPPIVVGCPTAHVRAVAEEHCMVDFPGAPPFAVGDTAELVCGYAPTTVNLHDVFHVLDRDTVVDVWPVAARGAGPPITV
jgi:D-serine deaminase-like pyridoxal phosphate-dependent protein